MKILVKLVILAYVSTIIQAELKLLNVIFRHGDRAVDNQGLEQYPNDPYANVSFFPIGSGGLTNAGKLREYHLGQFLRKHYGDFLGPFYYKGIVSARSTFIERTRQSLQLVLAGLYPPKGNQTWNQHINWQPIPTTYVPHLDDILMISNECPKFLDALDRVLGSMEYQKKLDKFIPLMKNLTINSGKPINDIIDVYFLYQTIATAHSLKLQLPKWTEGIFPRGQLYDGALLQYKQFGYNDELKRLNGGMLLRKITDDMTVACEDKLKEPRKVFLYSGHEFNIVAILQSLNAYKPHVPRFSAAVIVELHKENGSCFVEVKHYRGFIRSTDKNKSIVQKITVPGCSKTCTLTEFKNILKNHIATDDDITSCDKRSIPEFLKTYKNIPKVMTNIILADIKKEKKNQPKLE